MPAKSPAQQRFMQGVAHGMKPKGGVGPSPEVAQKFLSHGPALNPRRPTNVHRESPGYQYRPKGQR